MRVSQINPGLVDPPTAPLDELLLEDELLEELELLLEDELLDELELLLDDELLDDELLDDELLLEELSWLAEHPLLSTLPASIEGVPSH